MFSHPFLNAGWTPSEIPAMIERGEPLEAILKDPTILSSFRANDTQLLYYLFQPEQLDLLIKYVTVPSPEDAPNILRYQIPFVVFDILTSESDEIQQYLIEDDHLNSLLSFFEQDTISPLHGHYVSHILRNVLTRHGSDLLPTLLDRNFPQTLLKHLDCLASCEIFVDIMVLYETQQSHEEMLQYLSEQKVFLTLFKIMKTTTDPSIPKNIGQIVTNILSHTSSTSRTSDLDILFGPEEIEISLSILSHPEDIIPFGVFILILIEIVWELRILNEDGEQPLSIDDDLDPPSFVQRMLLDHLDILRNCLLYDWATNPQKAYSLPPYFCVGKSVGNYRLKTIVLLSTIIRSGYGLKIDDAFLSAGIIPILVDMFFNHPSNSVLHSELYTFFEQCIIYRGHKLKQELVINSGLVSRIVDCLVEEEKRRQAKIDRGLNFEGRRVPLEPTTSINENSLADGTAAATPNFVDHSHPIPPFAATEPHHTPIFPSRRARMDSPLITDNASPDLPDQMGAPSSSPDTLPTSQRLTSPIDSTLDTPHSISSKPPTRSPSPYPPLFSQSPITIPPQPAYVAYVLHLARLTQEIRADMDELNEHLNSVERWTELYDKIVLPEMKNQETQGQPILYDNTLDISLFNLTAPHTQVVGGEVDITLTTNVSSTDDQDQLDEFDDFHDVHLGDQDGFEDNDDNDIMGFGNQCTRLVSLNVTEGGEAKNDFWAQNQTSQVSDEDSDEDSSSESDSDDWEDAEKQAKKGIRPGLNRNLYD
ncbi:hypothetical protein BLNAU_580 [Blattamonas nauphoetae]|uniref:Uncharacterized protein n=1 Tax=Blattamonas nauphoetae TaxID=2049346 RepID=A0ABQ9YLM5_9EUKA|nr:hypothetical protein BLNAU_580 [Blattamonas nauphoetae]